MHVIFKEVSRGLPYKTIQMMKRICQDNGFEFLTFHLSAGENNGALQPLVAEMSIKATVFTDKSNLEK